MGDHEDQARGDEAEDPQERSPRQYWRDFKRRLKQRGRILDDEEFWTQVLACRKRVYRYIVALVHDRSDAEDLMTDVLITAYERRTTFLFGKGSFEGWVLGIAWHKAMNRLRDPHRRRQVAFDQTSQGHRDPGLTPDEILVAREDATLVAECLDRLKPAQRLAIQLFYGQGMSLAEIAAIQGTTIANVKVRLNRGRDALAERLRKYGQMGLLSPRGTAAVADWFAARGGFRIIDGDGDPE